jgi:branched-chain amino acid transport system substrate-binding protein
MTKNKEQNGIKVYNRRAFLKTAAITGAGALVAAGCGQAGQAPPPSDTKPVTPSDFKVGVLLPYSKVFAMLGEHITKGMELYLESVDFTAGGRRIFLIKEDYENDAQVGMRKARKLIESDKVELMTGVVNSGVIYALRDFIHNSKMPMIVSNAGGNLLTRDRRSPYIYRASFSAWQVSYPMGRWVAENVSKRVVTSAADFAFGQESVAAFKESFLAAGGTILDEVWSPLGTNDYGPFLARIKKANPEAVYCFYAGSDAVRFVKQYDEYGLKRNVKLASAGFMVENDVTPAQGDSALGVFSSLHWADTLDIPENKSFMKAFLERYGHEASVYAVQGYDAARVIVDALNKLKGDTNNKDQLLATISGIKFVSPRGPFSFDQETNNVIHDIYIREVQKIDGKLRNAVLAKHEQLKDPGK